MVHQHHNLRLGFLFSVSANSFALVSNQASISLSSGWHNHIAFRVQLTTQPLLLAFWLDSGLLVLCSKKTLDHWPFQQQATWQPTISPKVTYGGTEKQVSLFRGLWFPELMSYCASIEWIYCTVIYLSLSTNLLLTYYCSTARFRCLTNLCIHA